MANCDSSSNGLLWYGEPNRYWFSKPHRLRLRSTSEMKLGYLSLCYRASGNPGFMLMLALWMVLQRGWRTRHWWTPSAPPIDHTHHRFMLSLQRRTRPIQHARSSRQQTYNTTSLFFVWLSPLVVGDWDLQHDRGKSRDRVADANPPRQAGRAKKGGLYVGRGRTHCSTKETCVT